MATPKLLVKVIEGRNLKASNVFVKLKINGQTESQKTKVIKNTSSPVWNKEFTFRPSNNTRTLSVKVYGWDPDMEDELLGEMEFPLDLLNTKKGEEEWQHVMVKKGSTTFDLGKGEIKFTFRYFPNGGQTTTQHQQYISKQYSPQQINQHHKTKVIILSDDDDDEEEEEDLSRSPSEQPVFLYSDDESREALQFDEPKEVLQVVQARQNPVPLKTPTTELKLNESDLVVKCSLQRFFKKKKNIIKQIQDSVIKINKIITESYHLLNLHIRRLLENGKPIPDVNRRWLRQLVHSVSTVTGRSTLPEDKELQTTYETIYSPLLVKEYEPPSRDNLADCIEYAVIEMETALVNNIQIHFVKRQMKFLSSKYPKEKKKELWKLLNEYNDGKHPTNEDRRFLLPANCSKSVEEELKTNPLQFLLPMFQINRFLETKGLKMFALLPVRHGFIPRNIRLTTRDLRKLLKKVGADVPEQKKKKRTPLSNEDIFIAYKLDKIGKCNSPLLREWLLSNNIKLTTSTPKPQIVECVLSCIRDNFKDWDQQPSPEEQKKTNKKRKDPEQMEEDAKVWDSLIDSSRVRSYEKRGYCFAQSIITDGISVSVPLRLKEDVKPTKKKRKKEKKDEKVNYSHLKGRTIVGVDPGKHAIIYLTSDEQLKHHERVRMQISNVERRRALKTKVYQYRQNLMKKEYKEWQQLEAVLSKTSSKSSSLEKFQQYVKNRHAVQGKLYRHYANFLFRIHRWWRYKNEKRFQHNMVKQIGEKFGKNCVLAYGMWNRKSQMRGLIPSPTCGLRRALAKHFTVVDTPEPYTTKTCSKCMEGEMGEVMRRPHPNPKKRHQDPNRTLDVRGLRRCKNENCRVFINRDYNAAINIRRNLVHCIEHGEWHPKFSPKKEEQDGNDDKKEEQKQEQIYDAPMNMLLENSGFLIHDQNQSCQKSEFKR